MARKKQRKRSSTACTRKTITIKSKRGKVIAQFKGRQGPGCGPRPKPKTGHLSAYKKEFARQARACKGRTRGAFLSCMKRMGGAMPAR